MNSKTKKSLAKICLMTGAIAIIAVPSAIALTSCTSNEDYTNKDNGAFKGPVVKAELNYDTTTQKYTLPNNALQANLNSERLQLVTTNKTIAPFNLGETLANCDGVKELIIDGTSISSIIGTLPKNLEALTVTNNINLTQFKTAYKPATTAINGATDACLLMSNESEVSYTINNNSKLTKISLGNSDVIRPQSQELPTTVEILNNLTLNELSIYNANLQNIDFSTNKALTDASVWGSTIKTLDFSKNTNLNHLSIIDSTIDLLNVSNTNLNTFQSMGGTITKIDATNDTNLVNLIIEGDVSSLFINGCTNLQNVQFPYGVDAPMQIHLNISQSCEKEVKNVTWLYR